MLKIGIILDSDDLTNTFIRLCKSYKSLSIAVAWCGDPVEGFPYSYLKYVKGRIKAAVGVDFNHSHPLGLEKLIEICAEVRIASNPEGTFHPKLYIFESRSTVAILLGSANLTKSAFSRNDESMLLVEGSRNQLSVQLNHARRAFDHWFAGQSSTSLTNEWLRRYRSAYNRTQRALKAKVKDSNPSGQEAQSTNLTTFLGRATWRDYYQRVQENRKQDAQYNRSGIDCWAPVLMKRSTLLPSKWSSDSFSDLELRAFLSGSGKRGFGGFGHVGSSGRFLGLLANGSKQQKTVMANAFNYIRSMQYPQGEAVLLLELRKLCALGPTMKVWGRILLLLRPELFITVSYPNLRKNLARELGVTRESFSEPSGYLKAIRRIHGGDWYNSDRPKNKLEALVWYSRAAYVDAVLRDE